MPNEENITVLCCNSAVCCGRSVAAAVEIAVEFSCFVSVKKPQYKLISRLPVSRIRHLNILGSLLAKSLFIQFLISVLSFLHLLVLP